MPDVVSCILKWKNKILILQRSEEVGTYKRLWGGITGFIESDERPLMTAYKEILEEVGISEDEINLKISLEPISFTDSYNGIAYTWVVHPFVFILKFKPIIQLDWEHITYEWIDPIDIVKYDTVPMLREIVQKIFR
jgi:8-oxo-dGTP pyrophosphatase MutT (NUDIX family)